MLFTRDTLAAVRAACRPAGPGFGPALEVLDHAWPARPPAAPPLAGANYLLWGDGHARCAAHRLGDLVNREVPDRDGYVALALLVHPNPGGGGAAAAPAGRVYVLLGPGGTVVYASPDPVGHAGVARNLLAGAGVHWTPPAGGLR